MKVKEKENNERVDIILKGLKLAYEKLLAEKRTENSELVVIRNNKIVIIKP